ncbi:hypothetical protein DL96DRAFT_1649511 [Flagelloscypha sp. PMI_526]|nr:hypothetical protein DL96DRAFT_1649511 [Flagelloscypha sp. PMI_526]
MAMSHPLLPLEVLLEIFSYHCDSLGIDSNPYEEYWLGPLFLSQVCRHWRFVAESHASLWTVVPFALPYQYPELALPSAPHILDKWLGFSKDMPLEITVYANAGFVYRGNPVLEETIFRAIDILLASSHRWKILTLDMMGGEDACPDWIPTSMELLALEEFALFYGGDRNRPSPKCLSIVSNAPRLRKFNDHYASIPPSYHEVHRPFLTAPTQLFEIQVPHLRLNIHEANDLLALQPCLKILTLSEITFGSDIPSNVVSHALLSEITLGHFDEQTSAKSRFDGLVLPHLTRCILPRLPISAGSALLRHLIETAKGTLRDICCEELYDSFIPPIIHFYYDCRNRRSAQPFVCDGDPWIDSLLRFLQNPALGSSEIILNLEADFEQFLFWRSAIKTFLCRTLRKYAKIGLGGPSLLIELNVEKLQEWPLITLKDFLVLLSQDVIDEMDGENFWPWASTAQAVEGTWGKAILHFSPRGTSTLTSICM